jgi:hypothetical protein
MDSQRDIWWDSEITEAESWAANFEREAQQATTETARAGALERAAEASRYAQQLRESRAAGWPGPYRDAAAPGHAGLTDAERAAAQQIANGARVPVEVVDVQAERAAGAAGRWAEVTEKVQRADQAGQRLQDQHAQEAPAAELQHAGYAPARESGRDIPEAGR